MNIHEYQAKSLLRDIGVAVPAGELVSSVEDAEKVANKLGGPVWGVKAQIHAGGRGKGGGVQICHSVSEVVEAFSAMIGMQLVTPQTGPKGKVVRKVPNPFSGWEINYICGKISALRAAYLGGGFYKATVGIWD